MRRDFSRLVQGRLRADGGSAPAAVLAWVSAAALMVSAALAVGLVAHAHSEAQSVADLAALSASDSEQVSGDGCAIAAQLVNTTDRMQLAACEVRDGHVHVTVQHGIVLPILGEGRVVARAHSGPEPPPGTHP